MRKRSRCGAIASHPAFAAACDRPAGHAGPHACGGVEFPCDPARGDAGIIPGSTFAEQRTRAGRRIALRQAEAAELQALIASTPRMDARRQGADGPTYRRQLAEHCEVVDAIDKLALRIARRVNRLRKEKR